MQQPKPFESFEIYFKVLSKESRENLKKLLGTDTAEVIAHMAHSRESLNPGSSLTWYCHLLSQLLLVSNKVTLDTYNFPVFQLRNMGIRRMGEFFRRYSWLHSYEQVLRFQLAKGSLSPNPSSVGAIYDSELVIRYLKDSDFNLYKQWAPVILFYCGGAPSAYYLFESLIADDEDVLSSMRLYYYYLRCATYTSQSTADLECIRNASLEFFAGLDDADDEETRYHELIDRFDHRKYDSIVRNDEPEEPVVKHFFVDDDCRYLNEVELDRFLEKAERFYEKEKSMCFLPIWTYFDLNPSQRRRMYKYILDKEVTSIDEYFARNNEIRRMSLMLGGASLPGCQSLDYLFMDQDREDLERCIFTLLCENRNSIDRIILVAYYLYVTDIQKGKERISTVDFISLLFWCGNLKHPGWGNEEKSSGNQQLMRTVMLQSVNLVGLFDKDLLLISGLVTASLQILFSVFPGREKKEVEETDSYSYADYLAFKDELIEKFKKDQDDFGNEFYEMYPVFRYFSEIGHLKDKGWSNA